MAAKSERADSQEADEQSIGTKRYHVAKSTVNGLHLAIWLSGCLAIAILSLSIAAFAGAKELGLRSGGPVTGEIIPLVFNLVVSVSTDALSYAHSVSLRWALYREGRLRYNSNLRLLTRSRRCWLNGWPVNVVSALCLITSHTGANQTLDLTHLRDTAYTVSANPLALLMLGIGFIGQTVIAALCLRQAKELVWSWSPDAMNTALAQLTEGALIRRPGRGMMSVVDRNLPAQPMAPRRTQPPMARSYKTTRMVPRILIVVLLFMVVVATALYIPTAMQVHVADRNNDGRRLSLFMSYETRARVRKVTLSSVSPQFVKMSMFGIGAIVQAIVTMTLHLVELVVNVSRDEAQWRACATSRGRVKSVAFASHALYSAVTSWSWWVLFLLKPLSQWLFGLSLGFGTTDYGEFELSFNCVPLFAVAGVMAALLGLVAWVEFKRPQGPQPAAFGHLQTLVDLIDDWGEGKGGKLFWGVKNESCVGTSRRKDGIQDIDWDRCYE